MMIIIATTIKIGWDKGHFSYVYVLVNPLEQLLGMENLKKA